MSPPPPVRVLGIAGSLRAGSFNRALLRAAREEAPQGMEVQLYDIAPIPFYNADVEAQGDPEPVALLGATAGRGSTFQAQAQVREALVYAGSSTLAQPELSLSRAGAAFDDALQPLRLTDPDTRSALQELLDAFAQWVRVIRTGEGDRYAALHAQLSSDEERVQRAS
jgi:chromate reductase